MSWFRNLNYARAWRGYQPVWGADIYHPSLDRWLYLLLHRLGRMGQLERQVIEACVRPGMAVLDLGGNVGLYTALFSRCVGPEGKVTVLEPAPELHQALLHTMEKNHLTNIDTYACAAGSMESTADLALDFFNSGNNWIEQNSSQTSSIKIPVRRVDGLSLVRPLDFIKIDIQGWEVEALRGMTGLLTAAYQPTIYCEVCEKALQAAGSSARELGQFFLDHGYALAQPALVRAAGKSRLELRPLGLTALVDEAQKTSYFDILATPSPGAFGVI